MRLMTLTAILALSAGSALAQNSCANGKTLKDGVLTVATGNPAYFPWVLEDDPSSQSGFEAAMAYTVAERMGFKADQVDWVRTSFDEAIQPGAKNFDVNLQQFSITEDREKVVDFSVPYYSAAMAVLTTKPVVDGGAKPDLASLKTLKWGAQASTTAVPMLQDLIGPDSDPLLYNDNADVVEAMKSNQIDAALFDLPTALYLSAVTLDNGVLLGQFPADRTENPDRFGMLMSKGNPLKECVDAALTEMSGDGTLDLLEDEWLAQNTGVPVIK
ncbi:ABC transporter substrate-binding protein [Ruegeria sp. 2205SS24-7]|uniref:ABC transporter substrate-binding protein n=1 Tax=Ruegeria discodermiae TaxID=3064389 RepID=UPI00274062E7|nr:ABC transporter substrate-binding protein [Ruegeria sp. 2205SS24-7]MDP5216235.1 ABC transporter substrate-binding protein [Ruegeria sp. 2205SS24-7]